MSENMNSLLGSALDLANITNEITLRGLAMSADKFREEQLLRLDTQDKLAVADETICVLEDLLARVTAKLKQVSAENSQLRTENCILKLGNANQRDPLKPPFRIGDTTVPTRYPEWYLRPYTGDGVMLLSSLSEIQAATNTSAKDGDIR